MTRKIDLYGPLQASWSVRLESGALSLNTSCGATRKEVAYFRREGRTEDITVTRIEYCPASGCNADGTRSVRGARGMYKTIECVNCRGCVETDEGASFEPMLVNDQGTIDSVLAWFGMRREPAPPRYDGDTEPRWFISMGGWELPYSRGNERALWRWLADEGYILILAPDTAPQLVA